MPSAKVRKGDSVINEISYSLMMHLASLSKLLLVFLSENIDEPIINF